MVKESVWFTPETLALMPQACALWYREKPSVSKLLLKGLTKVAGKIGSNGIGLMLAEDRNFCEAQGSSEISKLQVGWPTSALTQRGGLSIARLSVFSLSGDLRSRAVSSYRTGRSERHSSPPR